MLVVGSGGAGSEDGIVVSRLQMLCCVKVLLVVRCGNFDGVVGIEVLTYVGHCLSG